MNFLTINRSEYTGILLAGGKSSRLGQEKGLLMYQGITLAQRAVDVLSIFCDRVLIITSNQEYQQEGVELIPDLVAGRGPMMGIYSGLIASKTNHNLVLAVDNPFINREFYEYLLEKRGDFLAAVPFLDNRYFEPLAGYYHKDLTTAIVDLMHQGNYKISDLLVNPEVLKLRVDIDFSDYYPGYFNSINTPDDKKLLQK